MLRLIAITFFLFFSTRLLAQDTLTGVKFTMELRDHLGSLREKAEYLDGKLHGIRVVYWAGKKTPSRVEEYYLGLLNGTTTYYFMNGSPHMIYHYSNGLADGKMLSYNRFGINTFEGHMNQGKRAGVWVVKNFLGGRMREMEFDDNDHIIEKRFYFGVLDIGGNKWTILNEILCFPWRVCSLCSPSHAITSLAFTQKQILMIAKIYLGSLFGFRMRPLSKCK